MIDKKLANQYGDLIQVCRALKPHATNMLIMDDDGHVILQPVMNGILNWCKINLEEVDISPFVHTYLNIPEASYVNTRFRKTKSNIDWILKDGDRFLRVENPDGSSMDQPIISDPDKRTLFYTKNYARLQDANHVDGCVPLKDIPDGYFEELDPSICDLMVAKKQVRIVVGGHEVYISKPLLGDLKKTEWVGAKILHIREPEPGEVARKATIYFKQRDPLMEVYTYGAFLILEE